MNIVPLLLIVVSALASIGVAALTWRAMSSYDDQLRSFRGFDGMHFED